MNPSRSGTWTRSEWRLALAATFLAASNATPAGAVNLAPEAGAGAYYAVMVDLRACPTPECGGVFVGLLNHPSTPCYDGQAAALCHTRDVDWSRLGLNPTMLAAFQAEVAAGRVIARGLIRPGTNVAGFGHLGLFVVTEGWISASDRVPRGRFSRVSGSAPCPGRHCDPLQQLILNAAKRRVRNLGSLDLSHAGASDAMVGAALEQLGTGSILVAGWNRAETDSDPATGAGVLLASQFYLRLPKLRSSAIRVASAAADHGALPSTVPSALVGTGSGRALPGAGIGTISTRRSP